jgi:hypothetical protein
LGSDFDTALGVYTGTSPTNLVKVPTAINDDDAAGYLNSQASFYAQAGTTYLIAVDGFHGAQGNIVLSWTYSPGSLPDSLSTPLSITTSNGGDLVLNIPWSQDGCDWFQNGNAIAGLAGALLITNADDAVVGPTSPNSSTPMASAMRRNRPWCNSILCKTAAPTRTRSPTSNSKPRPIMPFCNRADRAK